jgi:hypothetical protein
MRVCEEAGNVIGTDQYSGGVQTTLRVTSHDLFEYHVEPGIIDYRRPTVRFSECSDFFLARCARCAFYLFGRPTGFKLPLENHAVFPLLDALSNKLCKLVLRVRSLGAS